MYLKFLEINISSLPDGDLFVGYRFLSYVDPSSNGY